MFHQLDDLAGFLAQTNGDFGLDERKSNAGLSAWSPVCDHLEGASKSPTTRHPERLLPLNAGVPGIAVFRALGSFPLAPLFCRIRDSNHRKILQLLIAELSLNAQANRCAVRNRKVLAVHSVGQKRLRMPGVGHIQTVPP